MLNNRYAVVVRLWRVKTDSAVATPDEPTESFLGSSEIEPSATRHWRGAVQLAGGETVRYFDSLLQMNQIIEQMIEAGSEKQEVGIKK